MRCRTTAESSISPLTTPTPIFKGHAPMTSWTSTARQSMTTTSPSASIPTIPSPTTTEVVRQEARKLRVSDVGPGQEWASG